MRWEKLNKIKETRRLGLYRSSGLFIQLGHQIGTLVKSRLRAPSDVLDRAVGSGRGQNCDTFLSGALIGPDRPGRSLNAPAHSRCSASVMNFQKIGFTSHELVTYRPADSVAGSSMLPQRVLSIASDKTCGSKDQSETSEIPRTESTTKHGLDSFSYPEVLEHIRWIR